MYLHVEFIPVRRKAVTGGSGGVGVGAEVPGSFTALSELPACDPSEADEFFFCFSISEVRGCVRTSVGNITLEGGCCEILGNRLCPSGIIVSVPPLCSVFKQKSAFCFTKSPVSRSTYLFLTC